MHNNFGTSQIGIMDKQNGTEGVHESKHDQTNLHNFIENKIRLLKYYITQNKLQISENGFGEFP